MRLAAHPAGGAQILGDCLTQRQVALGAVVAAQKATALLVMHGAIPAANREGVQIRQAGLKGQAGILCAADVQVGPLRQGRKGTLVRRRAWRRSRAGPQDIGANIVVHEYAPAGTPLQESLCLQLVVDRGHSVAADTQVLGQLSTGGQATARQVAALKDALGKLLIELVLQWGRSVQPNIVDH